MTLSELNSLSYEAAFAALHQCCGSRNWVLEMLHGRPYKSQGDLLTDAKTIWNSLSASDWKEAFSHHPKIGDVGAVREKFAATARWAEGEQAAVMEASNDVLQELARGNDQYEKKFGYIFIVCATGKSIREMLDLLNSRLPNDMAKEIRFAAEEQQKITNIRLNKLFEIP